MFRERDTRESPVGAQESCAPNAQASTLSQSVMRFDPLIAAVTPPQLSTLQQQRKSLREHQAAFVSAAGSDAPMRRATRRNTGTRT
jgi:hypothetical protein